MSSREDFFFINPFLDIAFRSFGSSNDRVSSGAASNCLACFLILDSSVLFLRNSFLFLKPYVPNNCSSCVNELQSHGLRGL